MSSFQSILIEIDSHSHYKHHFEQLQMVFPIPSAKKLFEFFK
ncbi:hypothetical protein C2W59_01364 [Bacillus pumilus]|uniref:Uncharacterized protein n=1 Tax=Bacillus pumilus TaxID=1408 RepID=A0AB34R193_BACPU|nr:hypothetical protein B4127_0803 [Bacillus pumilus]RAP09031.1 hypothetical protein C2W58_00710 [Bacillus pumilus]RAP19121.1 hypothetical protein C2W59_01364 [Bacillus pumilus]